MEVLKQFKKSLYLLIAACVAICGIFITACENGENGLPPSPENCEAVIETALYGRGDGCEDFILICNSLDEFKKLCSDSGYDFFGANNKENNYYNSADGEKIRGYTDEYFKDKAFVVFSYCNDAYSGQYRIEEAEVNANKLTLYIKYPENDTANDVINYVFLIAGVDKSFIADVTELEYVIR